MLINVLHRFLWCCLFAACPVKFQQFLWMLEYYSTKNGCLQKLVKTSSLHSRSATVKQTTHSDYSASYQAGVCCDCLLSSLIIRRSCVSLPSAGPNPALCGPNMGVQCGAEQGKLQVYSRAAPSFQQNHLFKSMNWLKLEKFGTKPSFENYRLLRTPGVRLQLPRCI